MITTNNPIITVPPRYLVTEQQDAALWIVDQEPWRRCWFCDSRLGLPSDDYCGSCGARFTPRRYRAEFHKTLDAGLLLELTKNSAIKLENLRLPVAYETLAVADGTVVLGRPVDGQTLMPLAVHDSLLLAHALFSGAMQLYQAGYTLGKLNPLDVVLHNDATVSLRIAPYLTQTTDSEAQVVTQIGTIINAFVDVPRITRRFDIADADVNPLLGIIADIRAGLLVTFLQCIARVESALVPYETRRFLHLHGAATTDVGLKRQSNEDSVLVSTMQWLRDGVNYSVGLYVVADGMGGHAAGEVASAMTVNAINEHIFAGNLTQLMQPAFGNDVSAVVQCIDDAVQFANQRIIHEARQLGNNMGTTLTMALVLGDTAYIANIGDSRTYLWRDDQLRRITNDHSLVMKLVELEHIIEADIYTHPQRNGVLRSMGVANAAEIDIYIERLRPNDMLLLCSDGLWEMVRDLDIAMIFRRGGTVDEMAMALQATANSAGGDDNISVVLVRCES
ncbi:MAG: serine/threonine-protein phosphatase [Chloroflexia bacterium]|nr:serine/threonine-protein phosphatase [Chloroflexia bacterium]